jgi:hypothetical protein
MPEKFRIMVQYKKGCLSKKEAFILFPLAVVIATLPSLIINMKCLQLEER